MLAIIPLAGWATVRHLDGAERQSALAKAVPQPVRPGYARSERGSEVCGQCHSLTDVSQDIELGEGKTYVAGDELENTMPLLRPLYALAPCAVRPWRSCLAVPARAGTLKA